MGSAAGGGASQTSQQATTLDQGAIRQQCQQYLWIWSVNDPTSIPMMTMIMITLKKCMPMVLSQKAFWE